MRQYGRMESTTLSTALAGAAARGELFPVFQPQLDMRSGRIAGAEALCRWRHPELGLVPPVDFIPMAEESGAILEIGAFMIDSSCAFAAGWHDGALEIAVNVSAVQLAHPDFSDRLIRTFRQYDLTAEQLTVEITESRPVPDIPDAVAQLERLRELGIGISIDDFGSGYSSLKQLDALPFTELKIDQSLIRDDTDETWSRVAAIVAIVRQRGMRIVAEGIETAEQYERVRDADCDRGQGYFLGMPMEADDFTAFAKANVRTPLPRLGAPARRALAAVGVRNLEDVAARGRAGIRSLHGVGPRALAVITEALDSAGLAFPAE